MSTLPDYKNEFIQFALEYDVLKLGDFTLKSGRKSPYFVNLGSISTGRSLALLSKFYAKALQNHNISTNATFYGPPYKGILLAGALAMHLDNTTHSETHYLYSRKEAKDHGEGGIFVGNVNCLQSPIIIVDDVLTAGTAVRSSISLLSSQNVPESRISALLVAMDRQERSSLHPNKLTNQDLLDDYGFPTISIITMDDLFVFLKELYQEIRDPSNENERRILNWLKQGGYEQVVQYRKALQSS